MCSNDLEGLHPSQTNQAPTAPKDEVSTIKEILMKSSPRRRAREFAVQALYQLAMNDTAAPEVTKNIHEASDFPRADSELFAALFFGAHQNHIGYIQLIRPLLNRDEKDINPVERAVLLTACHELAAMPETPYPVIINEAIEIAKTFGGTDSHKFINGILDKLAVQLRPNDPKRRPPEKH